MGVQRVDFPCSAFFNKIIYRVKSNRFLGSRASVCLSFSKKDRFPQGNFHIIRINSDNVADRTSVVSTLDLALPVYLRTAVMAVINRNYFLQLFGPNGLLLSGGMERGMAGKTACVRYVLQCYFMGISP